MTRKLACVLLLVLPVITVAQQPVPALPQTYIDTTYNPPIGVTWYAHTSADLNKIFRSVNSGDTIVLDAGATYVGNFKLPVKINPNNPWIYIVSSALASLPGPGTRVNPATDAVNMPKIVTTNATAAITIPPIGNHFRLVGLEVYSASTAGCDPANMVHCYSNNLINSASTNGRLLVDSITIDRCYIHGSPTQDVRQGVVANGTNFAIIDSYISDIHQSTNDSQGILATYTPGPLKITNNFVSATTEDIMFGGGGGLTNPYVPSDIEIRGNHFYKPLSWAQAGVTIPPNNYWVVKNNLEFKSAQRVLVDSNVVENVWVSGQMGFSVMLTPRTSQSGLNAVVDDITITNNIFKNVSSGFDTLESDNNCVPANGCSNPGEMKRVVFRNNLILLGDTTQAGYATGYAYGGLIMHDVVDFLMQHNTVVPPPNLGYCKASVYFSTVAPYTPARSSTHNVWVLDNVLCRQVSGPRGWIGQAPNVISDYMGDPAPVEQRLLGNVLYATQGDAIYQMPAHNYVTPLPFVYVDQDDSDYQLSSPYWADTSDGLLAGVNDDSLPDQD